jgi:parvulin-like peptidyl-prolyl isomerase
MVPLTKSAFVILSGFLFLWSLGLDGCNYSSSPPTGTEAKKESQINIPDDAVAVVNGVPVSKEEYNRVVRQFESMNPKRFQAMSPSEREQRLADILDQMIMHRLRLQEAQRLGIEVPEELVEQEYEAVKSTFPSEEAFLETLRKGNTNPTLWKKSMRDALLMRRLEESVANQLVIPDEEIQQYWNENREAVQKDLIHARQILVRTEGEAKKVLTALQRGMSFEAAVKEYSVDHLTKTKGGDLGWISHGDAFPEFQQAVFSLNPLQLSAPIKGRYGYHIVQVLEKKNAEETTFKDYREKIRELIRQKKWQVQGPAWLQGLRTQATIDR